MLLLKLICFLLLASPISPLLLYSPCLWNKQKMTESFDTFFFSPYKLYNWRISSFQMANNWAMSRAMLISCVHSIVNNEGGGWGEQNEICLFWPKCRTWTRRDSRNNVVFFFCWGEVKGKMMVAALLWKEKLHPSCQSILHSESFHGGKNFPPIVN